MLRRTTAILATAAALTLVVVAPTRAQAPPGYHAGATATALQLTLLGQQFAVSQTEAAISSVATDTHPNAPWGVADGAALLLAGTPVPGAAPSSSDGPPTNEVCPIQADLNEITQGNLSGLTLEVACVTTRASATDAWAGSGEVIIRVLGPGGAVLEPILGPALEGVEQVTEPLVEALAPLLGAIDDATQIDVANVLEQLTEAVGTVDFVLAEIVVAPAVSQATNTEGVIVAEAGSNAVTINILPGIVSTLDQLTNLIEVPEVTPGTDGPLLQVKLGAANARVQRDATGAPTEASAAQLLSITADDSLGILGDITGQLTDVLDMLSVGELNCEDGALADVLCIELGRVNELSVDELNARNMNFGEGTVGIEASAATVRVLPIAAAALGGDVLGLSLASATAAANLGEQTRQAPPAVPEDAPITPLPQTGGESAIPLTLALLAAGTAGVALVRRTRTV